jgi:hypothetical protein
MAVSHGEQGTNNRAPALKLGLLGAISGALAWAIVDNADALGLNFDSDRYIMLLPVGIFPGVTFGVAIALTLLATRRTRLPRAIAYAIASLVSYMAAFHVGFTILAKLQSDNDLMPYIVAGLPAGFAGSLLLGLLTRWLFPAAGRRLLGRSIIAGTLAGALLGLAALDPHNSWGFLAFFVLWQAIYAATLSSLLSDLPPRARASEVTA